MKHRAWKDILKEAVIPFILASPFFVWIVRYVNLDFSYDEIFTFDHFVLVPFIRTLTDYSAPNNHIFANILHQLYLRLLHIPDLFALMDAPYKIRLLQLAYSVLTMIWVYLIGRRFFNAFVGQTALLFLVTTIPFYNFATLVRGYSLSMMFVSLILYLVWSFENGGMRRYAVLLALCIPLALYTIPLNIYFFISLTGFYVFYVMTQIVGNIRNTRRHARPQAFGFFISRRSAWFPRREVVIIGVLCLGILLGVLLYVPFYKNFITNKHLKSHGLFYWPTLARLVPQSFHDYLSERYLLIPLLLIGVFGSISAKFRQQHAKELRKLACCLCLLFGPFLLSYIRGDHPPARAFVNIAPIFALTMAISMAPCQRFLSKRLFRYAVMSGLFIYAYGSFAYGIHQIIESGLKNDITQNVNRQGMYYNYYQGNYQPKKLVEYFLQHDPLNHVPMTLVYNLQEYEMRRYLDKYQLHYYQHPYQVLFNPDGHAYVVVAFAEKFMERVSMMLPDIQCQRTYPELNYHKILFCESQLIHNQ